MALQESDMVMGSKIFCPGPDLDKITELLPESDVAKRGVMTVVGLCKCSDYKKMPHVQVKDDRGRTHFAALATVERVHEYVNAQL